MAETPQSPDALPKNPDLERVLVAFDRLATAILLYPAARDLSGTRSLLSLIDDWMHRAVEKHVLAVMSGDTSLDNVDTYVDMYFRMFTAGHDRLS